MFKFITMMMVSLSVFACPLTQEEKDTQASNGYWDEDNRFNSARDWMTENEDLLKQLGYPSKQYNLNDSVWNDLKWD